MNDYGKQRFAGTVIGLFLLAAWGCPAEAGAWQDQMLLRWIKVKYEMKEYAEAHDKCQQVLFEYPGSAAATQAVKMLTVIQAACKKERGAFPTPPSSFLQPFQTNYTGTQFCSIEVLPNLSPTTIAEIVSGWATPYGQPLIFFAWISVCMTNQLQSTIGRVRNKPDTVSDN